ncbi:thermonuclease family protein [Desulfoferrobacter suflitae]|uniref:thermonuclease family protein n=1 Tax=Desulfoferrobacter suflitae TaxID=2865782 RepID=UPI0021647509|nr:thermonuclease family protein [Desulfoferrobacter suflitae]MCK8604015.1 thermonuclease family protein [Desulfoferrobacter suflitae]
MRWRTTFVLAVLFSLPLVPQAAEYKSYAIVKNDGSLRVQGRTIWLYGLRIPPTYESCLDFLRPPRCGPRAVLMLELKIDPYFVHCHEISRNGDGGINAVCTSQGEDLAAYMLQNGWAEALPHAPAEYHRLEKSARARNLGIWKLLPGDMIPSPPAGKQ